MLQINTSHEIPDGTYFVTEDAAPDLKDGVLTVYDGTGKRRSWGAPGVTSTVVLNTDDLVAVHIGFFHKHGGGQFWRYYSPVAGQWAQVGWAQLQDTDRARILIAHEDRSPSFANVPGKLRQDYLKPSHPIRITYKIVKLVGNSQLVSVFDGKTEYQLGKRLMERAVAEHGGGYYSYPSIEGVEQRFNNGSLFPESSYQNSMTLVLIECEISGTILDYKNGKVASTYLKPVKILKQFDYTPAIQEAS